MDSLTVHHAETPKDQVQNYIDATLAALLDELSSPDGCPTITLKRRSQKSRFFINPSNKALEASENEMHISYTWPGKDAHEAWRFSTAHRSPSTIPTIRTCSILTKICLNSGFYSDPCGYCRGSS